MNRAETARLLTMCAAYDNRTPSEAAVIAWHEALADLAFEDAKTAVVDHYRASREWIMPADVRQRIVEIRRHRLAALGDDAAVPDADPDDVEAYLKALREGRMRRASPEGTRRRNVQTLTTNAFREVPSDDD